MLEGKRRQEKGNKWLLINLFLLRMLSACGDLMYSSTMTFQRWRHNQPRKKPCTLRIFFRSSRSTSFSWAGPQPGLSHSFFNMHSCINGNNKILSSISPGEYPHISYKWNNLDLKISSFLLIHYFDPMLLGFQFSNGSRLKFDWNRHRCKFQRKHYWPIFWNIRIDFINDTNRPTLASVGVLRGFFFFSFSSSFLFFSFLFFSFLFFSFSFAFSFHWKKICIVHINPNDPQAPSVCTE